MARPPRNFVAGGVYHVFSRGSNRQAVFSYDTDRTDFFMCLERVVRRHELKCLAYCLMSNHYHLVVETLDGALSPAMKSLNGRYALRFNQRYKRDAHLFKNRFGAVLQETDSQFLQTLCYTVCNPVAGGLCAQPEEWPWSSYRACTGIEPAPAFLDLSGLLAYFGDEPLSAMAHFRKMVASGGRDAGV